MALFLQKKQTYQNADLLRLLSGNTAERSIALKELFATNFSKVLSYVRKNGGDADAAQEVWQHVMVKLVIKARDKGLTPITNLHGYLVHACKNHWLNLQRHAGKQEPLSPAIANHQQKSDIDPHQQLEREDFKQAVSKLLDRLGEKCRYLLIWSLGEGVDMKSVADELGYENAQTAMNLKSRCKKKLKELVRKNQAYQQLVQQIIFTR